MNDATQNGLRKAAILVSSLASHAAQRMLEQMGSERADRVRQAIATLGPIPPDEQRQIIEEFFRVGPKSADKHPPGIELDPSLARKLAMSAAYGEEPPAAEPSPEGPPFRFLRQEETEKLVKILAGERPQTVALVLAHLAPEQAGEILVRLNPAAQIEIIHRLVDLEETQPEILREVEQALKIRLSQQASPPRRRVAGMAAVAGILRSSGSDVSTRLYENLSTHDARLAEKLGPDPVDFAELICQDDATLATVLKAAGPELVMLSLVGAPPALVQRIVGRLPGDEAEAVRYRLDHLGPMRLSDVEEARRRIEEIAQRLILERRIAMSGRGKPAPARPQRVRSAA